MPPEGNAAPVASGAEDSFDRDPRTGRFTKGNVGKRKGSRNAVTVAIENLMEGEGERIGRVAIERALAGDTVCIKLVLDRIAPVRKGRALPQIAVGKNEGTIEALLRSVLEGHVTPEEGLTVVDMLAQAAQVATAHALKEQREFQMDALRRAREQGTVASGVMLVPLVDLQSWEDMALVSQRQLRAKVKE
jgi:hypothetical protein